MALLRLRAAIPSGASLARGCMVCQQPNAGGQTHHGQHLTEDREGTGLEPLLQQKRPERDADQRIRQRDDGLRRSEVIVGTVGVLGHQKPAGPEDHHRVERPADEEADQAMLK